MKILHFLLFNFFTKAIIRQESIFLNKRFQSIKLDFALIISMFIPIMLVLFIIVVIPEALFGINFINSYIDVVIQALYILLNLTIIILIINKDFFDSRSIAKRIQGYQIVDFKSNNKASEIQCMIRNITIIIWPIEFFILLFSPYRRLGDIIASTKLIDTDFLDPESIIVEMKQINQNMNYTKLIWSSIAISIIILSSQYWLSI